MTRTRRIALAGAAALAALVPASSAGAAGGLSVADVDTSAFPTVTLTLDAPADVDPGDLTVTESGQPAAGVEAVDAGERLAVALVIDTSRSMRGAPLASAIQSAAAFVAAQPAGTQIGVFGFGDAPYTAGPFSTDAGSATTSLQQLSIGERPGTAVYGAVALAAEEVRALDASERVVVVLSDGASEGESATLEQAIAAAADDVRVFPIAFSETPDVLPPLTELASATGGSVAQAGDAAALDRVYDALAGEIAGPTRIRYQSLAASGRSVEVAVKAAGGETATATVRAPGKAQAAEAAPADSAVPTGGGARLVLAGGAALLVLLATLVLMAAKPQTVLARRIAPFVAKPNAKAVEDESDEPKISLLSQLFVATEAVAGRMKFWQATSARLEQADLPLRTAELLYIQLGAAVVLSLVARVVGGSGVLLPLIALPVGFMIPSAFVRMKAKKRLAAFEAQLPETLITMAASLKAGHGFNQAVQSVVQEGQDPTAKEFARVVAEVQLGMPPDTALEAMAKRMKSTNFGFVVIAVNIQRTVGGSLADILDMVGDTVRQREQFSRKVKALTAQGRMSAYVLVGMPFFIGLTLFLLNRDFIMPLFTTGTGKAMVGYALVSIAFGSVVIKKIVGFKG